VLLVSDRNAADKVSDMLYDLDTDIERFNIKSPRLTLSKVRAGTERIHAFRPDVIVAFGGEPAMDVSKLMRVLYEDPDTDFFFRPTNPFFAPNKENGRRRVKLICAPIASGSGSEVTPFAILNGARVIDYALTPDVAIVDNELTTEADSRVHGLHALSRAIESYVSEYANEYTQGHSLRAARLLFQIQNVQNPGLLTDLTYNASTMAGLASATAWNSRSDSIAFALDELYQIPRWLTNAIVLPHVIHHTPFFERKYAELAVYCGLADPHNATAEDLVAGLRRLNRTFGVPERLRDLALFTEHDLERIAILACYDSLHFGFVLHEPSVDKLKQILIDSY
jgi:acetaldehyde dehydrogenase/alcohol dehydrogenase